MRVDVTSRFQELAPPRFYTVSKKTSIFSIEAKDLLNDILELENLLHRMKPLYLRPKGFIRTKGSRMSEEDKDELDVDVMELIKSCSGRIDMLKLSEKTQPVTPSVREYHKEVVAYLLERLKCIADNAKQMQTKRYQQPFLLSSRLLPECDRQKLDVLEQTIVRMRKEKAKTKQAAATSSERSDASALLSSELTASSPQASSAPLLAASSATQNKTMQHSSNFQNRVPITHQGPLFASRSEKLVLTEEENRRFCVENTMLHQHFKKNLEDAKKMESKMAKISNLMGQFADKIMEQQTDIELIQHHAQETKSNVTQSKRILEQTQKIGKGYGFMIFCFYITFSVILHMLHYFNS